MHLRDDQKAVGRMPSVEEMKSMPVRVRPK